MNDDNDDSSAYYDNDDDDDHDYKIVSNNSVYLFRLKFPCFAQQRQLVTRRVKQKSLKMLALYLIILASPWK